jgi:hypothetical protein
MSHKADFAFGREEHFETRAQTSATVRTWPPCTGMLTRPYLTWISAVLPPCTVSDALSRAASASSNSACATDRNDYWHLIAIAQADTHFPASDCGGLYSIQGQSIWGLWWIKWHWGRFLSKYFSFPYQLSFYIPLLHSLSCHLRLLKCANLWPK